MASRFGRRKELRIGHRQQVVDEEYRLHVRAAIEPAEIPIQPERKLAHIQIDGVSWDGPYEVARREEAAPPEDLAMAKQTGDGAACSGSWPSRHSSFRAKHRVAAEMCDEAAVDLVVFDPPGFAPMPGDGIDNRPPGAVVDSPETGRTEKGTAPAPALGKEVLCVAQIHAIDPVRRGPAESRREPCEIEDDVARRAHRGTPRPID